MHLDFNFDKLNIITTEFCDYKCITIYSFCLKEFHEPETDLEWYGVIE